MNIIVEGDNGIKAEVVQHSISPEGKEIITFNVSYGLIVHAEQIRHRLLSNSVKSNRAIPTKTIRKEVREHPYVPVWLGANQRGMVAENMVKHPKLVKHLWLLARYPAVFAHYTLEKLGVHKEVCNRLLNPWQYVSVTITGTEWDNFFALRLHKDAQKDIMELARVMYEAKRRSVPVALQGDELHVPYVKRERDADGNMLYIDNDDAVLTREQALMASAARVARSSYNNHDKSTTTIKNDERLYHMLVTSKPAHSSPVEAQAFPMSNSKEMEEGITHIDANGDKWSGNFKGWIQARQLLEDHTVWQYSDNDAENNLENNGEHK